jgi:hypothetical protein
VVSFIFSTWRLLIFGIIYYLWTLRSGDSAKYYPQWWYFPRGKAPWELSSLRVIFRRIPPPSRSINDTMSPTELNCQVFWNQYLTLLQADLLQVNYVKRSSFDFITHLEFSSLALQIWKTLCKSLEGICNVPIGCCNIPMQTNFILNFPNFLF